MRWLCCPSLARRASERGSGGRGGRCADDDGHSEQRLFVAVAGVGGRFCTLRVCGQVYTKAERRCRKRNTARPDNRTRPRLFPHRPRLSLSRPSEEPYTAQPQLIRPVPPQPLHRSRREYHHSKAFSEVHTPKLSVRLSSHSLARYGLIFLAAASQEGRQTVQPVSRHPGGPPGRGYHHSNRTDEENTQKLSVRRSSLSLAARELTATVDRQPWSTQPPPPVSRHPDGLPRRVYNHSNRNEEENKQVKSVRRHSLLLASYELTFLVYKVPEGRLPPTSDISPSRGPFSEILPPFGML